MPWGGGEFGGSVPYFSEVSDFFRCLLGVEVFDSGFRLWKGGGAGGLG